MEATLYITDKSGKRHWCTTCTYGFHQGEQRNLERHLSRYAFLDPATVRLVVEVNGKPLDAEVSKEDLDLLRDLGIMT